MKNKTYLFKIHHSKDMTSEEHAISIGIVKAKNPEEAKEKILNKFDCLYDNLKDNEIEEIKPNEAIKTFKINF